MYWDKLFRREDFWGSAMNLEKLEKMVTIVIRDLLAEDEERDPKKNIYGDYYGGRTKELRFIPQMEARVKNLMKIVSINFSKLFKNKQSILWH